jgi:hypothetical protein
VAGRTFSKQVYLPGDIRGKDARLSVLKSIKEVKRRCPDGIPQLDPQEEMKIPAAELSDAVSKYEVMEKRMFGHPVHAATDADSRLVPSQQASVEEKLQRFTFCDGGCVPTLPACARCWSRGGVASGWSAATRLVRLRGAAESDPFEWIRTPQPHTGSRYTPTSLRWSKSAGTSSERSDRPVAPFATSHPVAPFRHVTSRGPFHHVTSRGPVRHVTSRGSLRLFASIVVVQLLQLPTQHGRGHCPLWWKGGRPCIPLPPLRSAC